MPRGHLRPRVLGLGVAFVSIALVAAGVAVPANAATDTAVAVARILEDTNALRAANGKAPLVGNPAMDSIAQAWAQKLAQPGQAFAHNPDYAAPIFAMGATSAGENIASGYSYTTVVNSGWANSAGHKANVLGNFTDIGIGYYEGPDGSVYAVQDFGYFAAHAGQAPTPTATPTTTPAPSSPATPIQPPVGGSGVQQVDSSSYSSLPASAAPDGGLVVSNTNDSGPGSLRNAILSANVGTAGSVITFAIGSGHALIAPTSPLPPLTRQATIDGTSQPGYAGRPLIEIAGYGAGGGARGLYITGAASGSTIQGLAINRFAAQGIFIDTSSVTVRANYVGTTWDGAGGAGNGGDGIAVFSGTTVASANSVRVGGGAGDRNLVSANGGNGIGVTVQGNGAANDTVISGNFVGTNAAGTSPLGNGGDGILVNAAGPGTLQRTVIGGTTGTDTTSGCAGSCNLVSGNGANGIGLWHAGVIGSTVAGNLVGTDVSGTFGVGNHNIGIEVNETANNTVGGVTPAARNIFSANAGAGVFLTGAGATGNVVSGNYIGTNGTGTATLGNVKMGVGIGASPGAVGAHSDTIGGTTGVAPNGPCQGACNVISGNGQNGIFIIGAESYGHVIAGNRIGLDASGTRSLGNQADGIGIIDAANILIGGSTIASRNVISANGQRGVIITGASATGSVLQSNRIGQTVTGAPAGNVGAGVQIAGTQYISILANESGYNGGLGIDLANGSPIQNDDGDGDGGANHQQNFPVVLAASTHAGTTRIGGQLNSVPSGFYRLDFFASDHCNSGAPYDYGEGEQYLGSTDVGTDIFGNTAWGFTSPTTVAGNRYITATATRKVNGSPAETSELSQCLLVNAAKPALTNGATWFLKVGLTSGAADKTFGYGFPAYFLMCAWDPVQPGVKLPVIYSGGAWYMRASYTTGTADLQFSYGSPGDRPVCGDWNGDGTDTVGVVNSAGQWALRNTNSAGAPDAGSFTYGSGTPVVGDWDGDGKDSVGVVSSSWRWQLRNSNSAGAPDLDFAFGSGPGDPVVGDWDGDGTDTVAQFTRTGTWILRNSNSTGGDNGRFVFGFNGATPLTW